MWLPRGHSEFLPFWLKLILLGHHPSPFHCTMSISKELHDELCTSYASLALHDGDVSGLEQEMFFREVVGHCPPCGTSAELGQ